MEVRACYLSKCLAMNPDLTGMVRVSFTITASGAVGQVNVTETTLNHRETEVCLTEVIGCWRFPKPQGETVFVSYPFHFQRAED